MKNEKIPTILGLIAVTVGLIAGVLVVEQRQTIKLFASADATPKNVRITNIDSSSFTVSWTTTKQSVGFVKWGSQKDSLPNKTSDEDSLNHVHSHTVTNLLPSTTYYFILVSEDTMFDNNNIPWEVKTGPELPLPFTSHAASGTVVDSVGNPVSNALVYVTVGGGSPLSTKTSENGNWFLPISRSRNQNLLTYVPIAEESTLIEIHVQTGKDISTSAQLYPIIAQNSPPIVIGQANNFKNLTPIDTDEVPHASIQLPESLNQSSGFGELLDAQ